MRILLNEERGETGYGLCADSFFKLFFRWGRCCRVGARRRKFFSFQSGEELGRGGFVVAGRSESPMEVWLVSCFGFCLCFLFWCSPLSSRGSISRGVDLQEGCGCGGPGRLPPESIQLQASRRTLWRSWAVARWRAPEDFGLDLS